jgi:hypothetical protein
VTFHAQLHMSKRIPLGRQHARGCLLPRASFWEEEVTAQPSSSRGRGKAENQLRGPHAPNSACLRLVPAGFGRFGGPCHVTWLVSVNPAAFCHGKHGTHVLLSPGDTLSSFSSRPDLQVQACDTPYSAFLSGP